MNFVPYPSSVHAVLCSQAIQPTKATSRASGFIPHVRVQEDPELTMLTSGALNSHMLCRRQQLMFQFPPWTVQKTGRTSSIMLGFIYDVTNAHTDSLMHKSGAGCLQVVLLRVWGHPGSYRGGAPHLLLSALALEPGRRCGLVPGKAPQLVPPQ